MSATGTPTECIQAVGRLLVTTLKQDVSAECQDALQQMADAGTPLQYRFAEELHSREELGKRLAQIPLTELADLRSAIGSAATSDVTSPLKSMALMVLWAFIHNSTKELIPVTALSAQKLTFKTTSLRTLARYLLSLETHDARIAAIVNGGKANARLLPSLLSVEILRDYFQIMSLLLTSSYGTVFDSLAFPIVSDILKGFRVVCDIVSINFSWTSGDDKLFAGTAALKRFGMVTKALHGHS
uniref:Uncharacterized protein n=1 Tax=Globisporangium ultimum (strain ATCC 200006 / CBS 805.95 / DAOM BR144) TaxID=431595 RepID=K3X584_GLOUD